MVYIYFIFFKIYWHEKPSGYQLLFSSNIGLLSGFGEQLKEISIITNTFDGNI